MKTQRHVIEVSQIKRQIGHDAPPWLPPFKRTSSARNFKPPVDGASLSISGEESEPSPSVSMTISESQKCMRQSYIFGHLMSMRHAYIVDGWSRRQPNIILVH